MPTGKGACLFPVVGVGLGSRRSRPNPTFVSTSCPEACRCPSFVSLGVTLPDLGAARLQDTACQYVSTGGDEQSTTVRDVRLDAVAEGLPVRPIRSFAGQHHYPGFPPRLNPVADCCCR